MANINDFKLLNLKCDRYFDFFSKSLTNVPKLSDEDKTRFGFYFFIIEHICKIDISEIPDAINDTNFNSRFYGDTSDDYGIDAIDIDEEENCIRLFNFKFRGKFKPDQTQAINALSISSKFTNAIKHNIETLH